MTKESDYTYVILTQQIYGKEINFALKYEWKRLQPFFFSVDALIHKTNISSPIASTWSSVLSKGLDHNVNSVA